MNTFQELTDLYDSCLSLKFKNRIISDFLDKVFDKKLGPANDAFKMVNLIYQNINRSSITKEYNEYDPDVKNIYAIFLFAIINNLTHIVDDLVEHGINLSSLNGSYKIFFYYISFDVFKKLIDYGLGKPTEPEISLMIVHNRNEISDYCLEHDLVNRDEIIKSTLKHNNITNLMSIINRNIKFDMKYVSYLSTKYNQTEYHHDRPNDTQFKEFIKLLIEKDYNLNQLPIFRYCLDRESIDLFINNGFDIHDRDFINIFIKLVKDKNYDVLNILVDYGLDIKYLSDQLIQDNLTSMITLHCNLEGLFELHQADFNRCYVLCR